jgi:putative sigma-54 modulation protein
MQKKISARHFDLTDEMKAQAEGEMDRLTRYFDNIISADLVLDTERHLRKAELTIRVYKDTLTGTADSDDMYNSISMAVDKVKGQLQRYKGKLKSKKPEAIHEIMEETTRPSTDVDGLDA